MRAERVAVLLGVALLLSAAPVLSKGPRSSSRAKSSSSRTKSRTKKGSAKRRRERAQKAPTPERIREIQSALAREGAYAREPDGKWDTPSVEATKRYQAAHGLNATGKLDALTLQKLGLGSEVAGVAAPRTSSQPPPSSPLRPQ
ncbi:MAG TPA: peptidoglycan-binding domain-containing protein [Candidatus Acidoferrales bacterium]|jgi:peptidoglycan hydrolase-like protein with peptidoglycan-binding domain|nr:peptidoglycan-binding domain-containing protein [Candidatus Acidoferrales bacterium]